MIASLKGYGRIARTVLGVIAGLVVLGIVGSLLMGVRATSTASDQVVSQATAIADSSLTLAFTPEDLTGPVSSERAFELSEQIQSIVVDPSDFDAVTLLSPEGTILYSTATSRIGTELPGEQEKIREALKGEAQTEDSDGTYSVMLPLRFRSGIGGPAVVELERPNDPIASAAGPWRTNAVFLFAMLVLLGIAVFGVARVLQVVAQGAATADPPRQQPAPTAHVAARQIAVPQPGMREEGEARRRAEERAAAAEERLTVLQDQYRRSLEELQQYQHLAREPQVVSDPELQDRARRAEAELQTAQQHLRVLTEERQRDLAERERAIAERDAMLAEVEAARRSAATEDPDRDRRLAEAEQHAGSLRRQLDESHAEVQAMRLEIADLRSHAGSSISDDATGAAADASRRELLRAKDELAGSQAQAASAAREIDELRTELRVLRTEEQRATMLEDELRSTKAELESFRASHRADLVEREAEFEEKVRATREEFQRQLAEIETSYRGQLGQREADLAGRITRAEAAAREAQHELESTRSEAEAARAEAAGREARLLEAAGQMADQREKIAALEGEIKERTLAITQARKETDELRRSLVSMQADLSQTDGSVEAMRAELETERARAAETAGAADAADRDRRSLTDRVERLTQMLEEAASENAELNRRLQDFEARRQLELADDPGRSEIDDLLRVTQERLAGQTEKLIAAEDRVKELESEVTGTKERLEVAEGELRTHQMSEALREMREHPAGEGDEAHERVATAPVEDRRATSPFMKELSLDAKKSLTRIMGITQIMKHKRDGKEQAQLVKQLAAYARRLDATVADLADAEKLVQGTIELQVRRTDLEALVQRVVEESGMPSEREVNVSVEPVTLRIDPQRTEQILAGMLRVSGDRTSASKSLSVRLQSSQGGALLSVEDPEPSSDASMSPVVRRLAEIQGGWAKVESRDGGGSVFRVFLPDAEAPVTAGAPEASVPAPALQIVIGDTEGAADAWEPAAAEKILSQELRRLAELPADER